jgi:Family of unknown function (DUF6614)
MVGTDRRELRSPPAVPHASCPAAHGFLTRFDERSQHDGERERQRRPGAGTLLAVDVYELSVDLAPGVRDLEFVAALDQYLTALQADGRIEHWRLLRSKLGLGATREFKVLIETRDLAQLDAAFTVVSTRADPIEEFHHGVNSLVTNFHAALWRDFPDPQRVTGQERF